MTYTEKSKRTIAPYLENLKLEYRDLNIRQSQLVADPFSTGQVTKSQVLARLDEIDRIFATLGQVAYYARLTSEVVLYPIHP